MAAILITACTVTTLLKTPTFKIVKIVTPATADDGDTIDVSTLFTTGCFSNVSGATDNALFQVGAEYGGKSITIPGSTDNEARTILAYGE